MHHVPDSDLANIYVGCAQGLTVRRSALDEVGPFDERLSYSEDFDLVVRLVAANWQAWRLNMPLIVHAVHRRGGLSNAHAQALPCPDARYAPEQALSREPARRL
jgi:GT2 family glycosyltransferase